MQSYPLHIHNIVLFLVCRWKQTFGVHRVVSVADRTWENIDLTFGFDTPYLLHPPLEIATMIPCSWGLSHVHRVREEERVAKASPSPASHHAHGRVRGRCNQDSPCCTSWHDTSKQCTWYISIFCVYRCINYNACMHACRDSPFDTCMCWFNGPWSSMNMWR